MTTLTNGLDFGVHVLQRTWKATQFLADHIDLALQHLWKLTLNLANHIDFDVHVYQDIWKVKPNLANYIDQ